MSWTEFISPQITLANSESESAKFGFSVARLSIGAKAEVDEGALSQILADAFAKYRLVITRWEGSHQRVPVVLAKSALSHKFELIPCPTLIYWGIDLDAGPSEHPRKSEGVNPTVEISTDIELMDSLISQTFQNYPSHYAFNPYLPNDTTERAYRDWVKALSVDPTAWCQVIYATNDSPAGVGISKHLADEVAEVLLAGIAEGHQNQGLYPHLMKEMINAARANGAKQLVISTQASNIAVQRVWARVGLRPILSVENCHLISGTIKA